MFIADHSKTITSTVCSAKVPDFTRPAFQNTDTKRPDASTSARPAVTEEPAFSATSATPEYEASAGPVEHYPISAGPIKIKSVEHSAPYGNYTVETKTGADDKTTVTTLYATRTIKLHYPSGSVVAWDEEEEY